MTAHKTLATGLVLALAGATALTARPARAEPKKKVACTLPTIEALVREIAGDRVEVFSLAAGDQDPHAVSPTPSLMKRVRGADLLLEIGMQLELWADEVANGSGNPRIFRGAPGRVALSTGIPKLEIPASVSRAQGDVHPEGNPHLWLDPVRAKLLAENVAAALKAVSPQDAGTFDSRLRDFQKRVDRALFGEELIKLVGAQKLSRLALDGRLHAFLESNTYAGKKLSERAGGWLARARPLRDQKVIEFHKVWAYFATTFGFQIVGTIEEKPGIAPGPRHVASTVELVKRSGVKAILVDNFYDASLPERIAREGGARVVVLPNQVRGEKGVSDYFTLVDHVLGQMLAALAPSPGGARP
jgi:zinc/manganese transport system substrate-binding protein